MSPTDLPKGSTLVELPGVYDGWSVAILKDGSFVNRWDERDYPVRWRAAEDWIRGYKRGLAA